MLDLPDSIPKRIALFFLAIAFIASGINHFVNPGFFIAIMPAYLPAHAELVALSGVFEILGGLGVLVPRTRSLAGWGLVALLVAVFPANLHIALNPELFPDVAPAGLYFRLPIQFVFIAWSYWATRPSTSSRT
jgi:uncharacterized membrane protein